jgi:hypothetical protein
MWEPTEWIALGALAVAGLSLGYTWWDRRGARPDSYRAALYHRQLLVVEEFVGRVREAHLEVVRAADADRASRLGTARDELGEFATSSPFIPPEIVAAANEWSEALEQALGPDMDDASVGTAWRRFVRRVRRDTGSYDLHWQVRGITGAAKASNRHRERFARLARLDLEVDVMSRGRIPAPSDSELRREIDEAEDREDPHWWAKRR